MADLAYSLSEQLLRLLPPSAAATADQTIVEYVAGTLGDSEFEWGVGCCDALDAVGVLLVEGKLVADEAEALALLLRLQPASGPAPTAAAPSRLPVKIGGLTEAESALGGGLEKGRARVIVPLADLPESDTAKLEKRRLKEQAAAESASARRVEMSKIAADGAPPTIVRNAGGGGSRDIHLEDISVTNGGEELITGCSLTLACGRRYGLVGRNGCAPLRWPAVVCHS